MIVRGRVSIVGAGPGDPELITVRGLARIREADVLVYDRLVASALVAEAPHGSEQVFVGKAAGMATLEQRDIEDLLISRAQDGRHVVRLKGGDPFVFGRGGEELAALVAAGVPVEVVPGITSAIAVPGGAGIPVTHRGLASSLTIVTGHEDPALAGTVDWEWLGRATGTLVILMGLRRLPGICRRLIAEGRDPETPAAVIARGTLADQQVVVGSLADLARKVEEAGLKSPSLIIIGEVVRLRQAMAASLEPVSPLLSLLDRAS